MFQKRKKNATRGQAGYSTCGISQQAVMRSALSFQVHPLDSCNSVVQQNDTSYDQSCLETEL